MFKNLFKITSLIFRKIQKRRIIIEQSFGFVINQNQLKMSFSKKAIKNLFSNLEKNCYAVYFEGGASFTDFTYRDLIGITIPKETELNEKTLVIQLSISPTNKIPKILDEALRKKKVIFSPKIVGDLDLPLSKDIEWRYNSRERGAFTVKEDSMEIESITLRIQFF